MSTYRGSSPHTRGALAYAISAPRPSRIIPAYAGSTDFLGDTFAAVGDHPRIRGEHRCRTGGSCRRAGSSPHTRGAPPQGRESGVSDRIIPAYAGSTRVGASWTVRRRDHPRIRGEHTILVHIPSATPRIIPAYAGSTGGPGPRPPGRADHPRIRGEHAGRGDLRRGRAGSSPHTRGAPALDIGGAQPHGIIPAYAGSTPRPRDPSRTSTDHPRIRGEHGGLDDGDFQGGGSSPHTRGALGGRADGGLDPGIIPAYAGSTAVLALRHAFRRDHPRIRGEHSTSGDALCMKVGSSPHTRGAPPMVSVSMSWPADHPRIRGEHFDERLVRVSRGGSSPHTRGAPHGFPFESRSCPDHPRIRGEHGNMGSLASRIMGSSPHTRGAPIGSPKQWRTTGIIPAYAGSTSIVVTIHRFPRDHPRIRGEHLRVSAYGGTPR